MSSTHGGINPWTMKEAGINPDDVLDFSVSINPVPLPASIQKVIQDSAIYRYPDSRSRSLIEKLSGEYAFPPEELMVVNGTSQAIFLIAAAFLKAGDTTLIAGPTYSEYQDASEISEARIIEYRSKPENNFKPDSEELCRIIDKEKPKVFWICSPNNPTGSLLDETQLTRLSQACEKAECLMVLDEAYRCFAPPEKVPDVRLPNILSLHSMTKDFCIPGLRLGWLRAEADVVKKLLRRQPEWSVSAPAQDAGTACMGKLDFFEESWRETRENTRLMADRIKALGYKVFPTAGNFILVRIGDDNSVKKLSRELWKNLILVRDCASFGLEGFIRLGTRSLKDIDTLIEAIKKAKAKEA